MKFTLYKDEAAGLLAHVAVAGHWVLGCDGYRGWKMNIYFYVYFFYFLFNYFIVKNINLPWVNLSQTFNLKID